MEKNSGDIARTEIASLDAVSTGSSTEVTLQNSGETKLQDFDQWDVILQYYECGSATQVFYDDFETGSLSNWDKDGSWANSTDRSRGGGTHSARVRGDTGGTDDWLGLNSAIDISASGGMVGDSLTFSWYITSTLDTGEYLALDFWNGTTWVQIDTLQGNVDPEGSWADEIYDFSSYPSYRRSDFKLRFRGKMNASDEYGYVDLVRIMARPTTYHVERLTYTSGIPGDNQWTVEGIYTNADTGTPEVFDSGIFNPDEELVIQMQVNPAVGEGTTNQVTVGTPNGVSASAIFAGPD
ncbi:MAG: hypothetical protein WC749_04200 [Dehalococcoidia bacterium]